jgi:two-component system, NarL family, nitrate/nitrite response regulator NarL
MIGVLVLSETRLYREGLASALEREAGFSVVGTAPDPARAIAQMAGMPSPPDVVLLDRSVPEGARAVLALREASPGLKVVVIATGEVAGDILPWAEAGAAGFLPHDASFDDLLAGVAAVANGDGVCSPRMAAVLLTRVATLAVEHRQEPGLPELTRREREVALLLRDGLANKEIARHLKIEVATVKNHVHSILEKLHVSRRAEAASVVRTQIGI